jgi:hemerythrin-like domain-containing protein
MSLDKYLDCGIKELLMQFPKIGELLDEININCAECSAGTCELKEVVEIHNVSVNDEKILINKIIEIIYPEKITQLPTSEKKIEISKDTMHTAPFNKLVKEHKLIKRWLALIPKIEDFLDKEQDEIIQILSDSSDFINLYVDKYHQIKEEENIFNILNQKLEILKIVADEHERIRFHVGILLDAIEGNDKGAIKESLNIYGIMISEHITKEDEVLFPWIERNLSTVQKNDLNLKFIELETESLVLDKKYDALIEKLEELL